MFRNNQFMEDYKRGMEMIYTSAPIFAKFVAALGFPRPNTSIPTACVSWDKNSKKVTFEINPDFISELTDEQVGAVIGHEAFHVILQHLDEMLDKSYTKPQFLIEAQECIINDGLVGNIGLELPDGVLYGTKRHNQDFSIFTTREGYDFLLKKYDESDEDAGSEDKKDKSNGGSNSGGSSGGSGSDQSDGEESQDGGGQGSAPNTDASENGGCGGIQISEEDLEAYRDYIEKTVNEVLENVSEADIPDELADALSEITNMDGSSYGIGANFAVKRATAVDSMNMNWYKLVAEINPKIKDFGAQKPKDSWRKPPRRMTSVYPNVILPERLREQPTPKGKGNSLPTFIIALDLSGSIPRSLVNSLISLVDEIPEGVINAIPVTWSDYVLEYDRNTKNMVSEGGTNIDAVYNYAEQYAVDNNCDRPYVLVITDGECEFSCDSRYSYYNYYARQSGAKSYTVDENYVKDKWSWCAIQSGDEVTINRYFDKYLNGRNVYKLSDFTS